MQESNITMQCTIKIQCSVAVCSDLCKQQTLCEVVVVSKSAEVSRMLTFGDSSLTSLHNNLEQTRLSHSKRCFSSSKDIIMSFRFPSMHQFLNVDGPMHPDNELSSNDIIV